MKPPEDITVTLSCNNSCLFCPRSTLEHVKVLSREELLPRLEAIRSRSTRVALSGGEVTTLSSLPDLVALCRSLGFSDVAIITNARRLSDTDLTRSLVEAGLTEACVTLYDLEPEVHDALTRTDGSLVESLQGLDNLLALRAAIAVRVNTLLTPLNADSMHAMVHDLAGRGVMGFLVADVVLSDSFADALPHSRVREIASAISGDPDIRAPVIFRGFPTCIFEGLDVQSEPQDIDTTIVDDRSLEAYFAEFFSNFVHTGACSLCSESRACPGVQKRYLDLHGDSSLSPIDRSITPEAIARDLEGFEPWPDPGRLAVTPTTTCQARCTYCQVELGRKHSPPEVLDRSVDLLLTSSRDRVELQFFGGEPLIRLREVMRTMERGRRLALEKGKTLHFTLTTNGLLLDAKTIDFLSRHDCHVLFSLDGPPSVMSRYRPMARASKEDHLAAIEKNLVGLVRSSVPYFVNMVITPEAAQDLPERVRYLAGLGVSTVQICYALGPDWTPETRSAFCDALRACAALVTDLSIQNFGSHAEPVVLSNDLLVDVDGTLYSDAALFAEKALPGLRGPYRIGSIFEIDTFDGMRRSREDNLLALRRTYPLGSAVHKTIEDHLALGRQVQETLDSIGDPIRRKPMRDENPLLETVLKRSLKEQARLMARHPEILKLPLLIIENPCAHDCIFCLSKPLEPTPLSSITRWLEGNTGMSRLGLVGNEPLLHPEIDRIIQTARDRGFSRFDVLTTGEPLADPDRCRALHGLGLTGTSIPLWSADASTHDAITRSPGSHASTLAAIDNLKKLGAEIHVHANLLKQNIAAIRDLESFVRDDLSLPFCIIPVRPKDANLPWSELAPRYTDITGPLLSLVAFPLCIVRKVQETVVPPTTIISDVLKVYVLDQPFVKPPRCRTCNLRSRCAGTFQDYLDLHGEHELEPIT